MDLPNLGGFLNLIVYLVIPLVVLFFISSRLGPVTIICPLCGYVWEPRGSHSVYNPPARCPRCRKRLLVPPYYSTLENKDSLDENLDGFLLNKKMQGTINSPELTNNDLKRRIDARIKQRNLNIRTFWYNGKLMISKI